MGLVTPIPLRVAEKVIQRTYYVVGRTVSGSRGFPYVGEALTRQTEELTVWVLEQRRLRYNRPVVEAVDSLMKEKLGWW